MTMYCMQWKSLSLHCGNHRFSICGQSLSRIALYLYWILILFLYQYNDVLSSVRTFNFLNETKPRVWRGLCCLVIFFPLQFPKLISKKCIISQCVDLKWCYIQVVMLVSSNWPPQKLVRIKTMSDWRWKQSVTSWRYSPISGNNSLSIRISSICLPLLSLLQTGWHRIQTKCQAGRPTKVSVGSDNLKDSREKASKMCAAVIFKSQTVRQTISDTDREGRPAT